MQTLTSTCSNKTCDFARTRAHAKTLTVDSLRFVITDCCAARDASKGNANGEGYYQDCASTYAEELRARLKK